MLNLDLSQWSDTDLAQATLIRQVELFLLQAAVAGRAAVKTYTCLGQEYISVALSSFIQSDDLVFSTHRGHGHYLSLYDDPAGLIAEALGREGGVSGGSGRIARDRRFFATTIPGETLSVALGAAMQFYQAGSGQVAFVFVGDGSFEHGSLYEALNVAQLWRLPIVVVVENNGISQSTPLEFHMAGSIEARAWSFGMTFQRVSTADVNMIRQHLRDSIVAVRHQGGPLLIEFETVRLGPHSHGDDARDAATRRAVWDYDWFKWYKARYAAQLEPISTRTQQLIKSTVAEIEARPPVKIAGGIA